MGIFIYPKLKLRSKILLNRQPINMCKSSCSDGENNINILKSLKYNLEKSYEERKVEPFPRKILVNNDKKKISRALVLRIRFEKKKVT